MPVYHIRWTVSISSYLFYTFRFACNLLSVFPHPQECPAKTYVCSQQSEWRTPGGWGTENKACHYNLYLDIEASY